MFKHLARRFLPNPLDRMLAQLVRSGGKKVLLGWNRGLGDIALGLYAIIHRIRERVDGAEITFLTRSNLREGFLLVEGVDCIVAPTWRRGESICIQKTLAELGVDAQQFDLIIESPNPTDWVAWQQGTLTPKLRWNPAWDDLWRTFSLDEACTYIGIQPLAETQYGLWRNWPLTHWLELVDALVKPALQEQQIKKVLIFGFEATPLFPPSPHVIDLRGKTTLVELLSLIRHRCKAVILPDSGILSMVYYLDLSFPIRVLSLWGDQNHGILKQAVASPNPQLRHLPLVGGLRDLSTLSAAEVLTHLGI